MSEPSAYTNPDLPGDPLLSTAGAVVEPDHRPLNIRLGARLFVAADSFVFLAFLFAYFYLRSIDSNEMWRPAHTNPSLALGVVTLVLVTGTAASALLARVRLGSGDVRAFALLAAVGLALCLTAIIVQIVQLVNPGFSPAFSGGYGSVFIGFTGAFVAHLLGSMYWLRSVTTPVQRGEANVAEAQLAAISGYCSFALLLAGVEIVAFILIYVA